MYNNSKQSHHNRLSPADTIVPSSVRIQPDSAGIIPSSGSEIRFLLPAAPTLSTDVPYPYQIARIDVRKFENRNGHYPYPFRLLQDNLPSFYKALAKDDTQQP